MKKILILILLISLSFGETLKFFKGKSGPFGFRNRGYDWGYGIRFNREAGLIYPVRILGFYGCVYPVPYGERNYRIWILRDSLGYPTMTNPYFLYDFTIRIDRDTAYFVPFPQPIICRDTSFFLFFVSKDTLMSDWRMDSMMNVSFNAYWRKDTIFTNLGRISGDLMLGLIVEYIMPGIKEGKKIEKTIIFDPLGRKAKKLKKGVFIIYKKEKLFKIRRIK